MNRKHAVIAFAVVSLLVIALPLAAQSTTATIRGKVTNASGTGVGDAEVNAVSTTTGFVNTVKSSADGSYVLGGLRPGLYNIVVAAPGTEPLQRELEVRVGQTVDVDFQLTGTLVVSEAITVVGNQLADTKATEIGTNVTPEQIEALPQSDRNFLNFAELAPGITMSTDPANRTISAAGQPAAQTNVFIDGVSFKNDVQPGGIAGQNSSRGNPFPQNAVQEFRVLTQNYSAQYDHASTAVITAVTKSGTNKMDGSVFYFYQPRSWVGELPQNFRFGTVANNADYKRSQWGASIGGPITRDRLHYFVSAEVLDENAIQTVSPGTPPANAVNIPNLSQYAGTFASPFKSNLAFGKLSWQATNSQQVDFSASLPPRDRPLRLRREDLAPVRGRQEELGVQHRGPAPVDGQQQSESGLAELAEIQLGSDRARYDDRRTELLRHHPHRRARYDPALVAAAHRIPGRFHPGRLHDDGPAHVPGRRQHRSRELQRRQEPEFESRVQLQSQ